MRGSVCDVCERERDQTWDLSENCDTQVCEICANALLDNFEDIYYVFLHVATNLRSRI